MVIASVLHWTIFLIVFFYDRPQKHCELTYQTIFIHFDQCITIHICFTSTLKSSPSTFISLNFEFTNKILYTHIHTHVVHSRENHHAVWLGFRYLTVFLMVDKNTNKITVHEIFTNNPIIKRIKKSIRFPKVGRIERY